MISFDLVSTLQDNKDALHDVLFNGFHCAYSIFIELFSFKLLNITFMDFNLWWFSHACSIQEMGV